MSHLLNNLLYYNVVPHINILKVVTYNRRLFKFTAISFTNNKNDIIIIIESFQLTFNQNI